MELTKEEIEFLLRDTLMEKYQIIASALIMAIFNKMSKEETKNLTMAMVNSGDK